MKWVDLFGIDPDYPLPEPELTCCGESRKHLPHDDCVGIPLPPIHCDPSQTSAPVDVLPADRAPEVSAPSEKP